MFSIPVTARWVVHGVQGRSDSINYILDSEKTKDGLLVSGVNCSGELAIIEMKNNNEKFSISESDNDRTCYHGYQSFDPREKKLTPEEAHQIGIELMKKLYPSFQTVVSTHIDKGHHIHNHFIINAVNMEGRKLEDRLSNPLEGLYGLRHASDAIALEHGCMIIDNAPKIGRYRSKKYLHDLTNESWKSKITSKLEELKEKCFSFDDLLEELALTGYEIKSGKTIRIRPYGKPRFVTLKVLGEDYTEESLKRFFFDKRKNQKTFHFEDIPVSLTGSEVLKMEVVRAKKSKESVLLSMKALNDSDSFPKYYNSRYLEIKKYHQLVDSIIFLNENNIYSFDDLDTLLEQVEKEIKEREVEYQTQLTKNEIMQVNIPLCEVYFKYLEYYEVYSEQKDFIKGEIELSDEVQAFLEAKEELQVSSVEEVKEIIISASKIKEETNKQYAYLSYLKNKYNDLSKTKRISLETDKGYIKSLSFNKDMIDESRTTNEEYCIRIPYSDLYVFLKKECVSWTKYDKRANMYLIDDKEYPLYNKDNDLVEKVLGEDLENTSLAAKEKIKEYYQNQDK